MKGDLYLRMGKGDNRMNEVEKMRNGQLVDMLVPELYVCF